MARLIGMLAKAAALSAASAVMQAAAPPAPQAKADPAPPPDKIDTSALIDRIATRFGAFAIVAAVAYPVWIAADGLLRARAYHLPGLAVDAAALWLSVVLGFVLLLFALVFALLAFVPLLGLFDRLASTKSWFFGTLLAIPMVVCFLAYAILVAAIFTGDQLRPTFGDMARILKYVDVCGAQKLHGQICQNVLELCARDNLPDRAACEAAAAGYIDRIRPVVGPAP